MDNQDKLIDDVEVIAKKIKELHDLAYVRYSRLVDAVLAADERGREMEKE